MSLDAPSPPFSVELRRETWARHQGAAETSDEPDSEPGVLGALLDGELHLEDYAALTAQQHFVYAALDAGEDLLRDHPTAGRFYFPELSRAEAFDADLSLLYGPHWREVVAPLPETVRYVDRIAQTAREWPAGFVAHHYTRYLGDLSGGQAFRAAANAAYGFDDGPGVSFYVFSQIPDAGAFKDEYRRRLDRAGWDAGERRRVVAEVVDAYDYNAAVLAELATTMRRSL